MGSSWPAALRGYVCGNQPALSAASLRPHPQPEPTLLGRGSRVLGPRPQDGSVSSGLSGMVCDPAHLSGGRAQCYRVEQKSPLVQI